MANGADPVRYKYMPSVVLDGNFTAQHRKMKRPEDDVAIADGHAFMVRKGPYQAHLRKTLKRPDPVSVASNHELVCLPQYTARATHLQ